MGLRHQIPFQPTEVGLSFLARGFEPLAMSGKRTAKSLSYCLWGGFQTRPYQIRLRVAALRFELDDHLGIADGHGLHAQIAGAGGAALKIGGQLLIDLLDSRIVD